MNKLKRVVTILAICIMGLNFISIKVNAETAEVAVGRIEIDIENLPKGNNNIELLYILEKSNYSEGKEIYDGFDGTFEKNGNTYHYKKISCEIEKKRERVKLVSSAIRGVGHVSFAVKINNSISDMNSIGYGKRDVCYYILDCKTMNLNVTYHKSIIDMDLVAAVMLCLVLVIFIKLAIAALVKFKNYKKVFGATLITQMPLAIILYFLLLYEIHLITIISILEIVAIIIEIMIYRKYRGEKTGDIAIRNSLEFSIIANGCSLPLAPIITILFINLVNNSLI